MVAVAFYLLLNVYVLSMLSRRFGKEIKLQNKTIHTINNRK